MLRPRARADALRAPRLPNVRPLARSRAAVLALCRLINRLVQLDNLAKDKRKIEGAMSAESRDMIRMRNQVRAGGRRARRAATARAASAPPPFFLFFLFSFVLRARQMRFELSSVEGELKDLCKAAAAEDKVGGKVTGEEISARKEVIETIKDEYSKVFEEVRCRPAARRGAARAWCRAAAAAAPLATAAAAAAPPRRSRAPSTRATSRWSRAARACRC
jgi:hypothetical protein